MKHQIITLGVAALVLAGASVLVLAKRKQEHERAQCIKQLHDMHMAVRGAAGMENISPGRPIPGGVRALLLRLYTTTELPVCPSGGTYTFWSDSSYNANKDVFCSLAKSKGHDWPGEGVVPPQPEDDE